jgi:hypothetical protein
MLCRYCSMIKPPFLNPEELAHRLSLSLSTPAFVFEWVLLPRLQAPRHRILERVSMDWWPIWTREKRVAGRLGMRDEKCSS